MIDSLAQINGSLSSGPRRCQSETRQVSPREIYANRKCIFAGGTHLMMVLPVQVQLKPCRAHEVSGKNYEPVSVM